MYLSTHGVRSGSSAATVEPSVPWASRPGEPERVLMGMRWRRDSRGAKSEGRVAMGCIRGRKPRVVETMKAGRVVLVDWGSVRTGKGGVGREPILVVVVVVVLMGVWVFGWMDVKIGRVGGALDCDSFKSSQSENHSAYIDGGRNGFRPHGPASASMSACFPVALCQPFLRRRVPVILFVMEDGHETRVQHLSSSSTLSSAHRLKGSSAILPS